MDKTLLKNSWILAGLLLVISIILGLIILSVVDFFKLSSSTSGITIIVGAMLVGQIYVMNFKELMPKKLRINVTIIYVLPQIALVLLYIFILDVPIDYLLFFSILIPICLFYSFILYWTLGFGGWIYLKALQKREASKESITQSQQAAGYETRIA